MKDDSVRLRHMLDAANKIVSFLSECSSMDDFVRDEKTLSAVERQFEIIGEASRQLSIEFQDCYPEVEWNKIQGLRNLLAHEYFGINTASQ